MSGLSSTTPGAAKRGCPLAAQVGRYLGKSKGVPKRLPDFVKRKAGRAPGTVAREARELDSFSCYLRLFGVFGLDRPDKSVPSVSLGYSGDKAFRISISERV